MAEVKRLLALPLACLCLTGCVTGRQVFHMANAVDAVQTINAVSLGPCYENNTFGEALMGQEPPPWKVATVMLGVSLVFEGVRYYLPERWKPWYDWTAAIAKGRMVVQNELNSCGVWD